MIVVCTGCSAKFRVADEKVGPRGAKLRCSKCHTVFTVQSPVEVPPAPPPAPPPPEPAAEPSSGTGSFSPSQISPLPQRHTPPPLPRRSTTTLDARAAFDVDLEPHLTGTTAPAAPADPFAPPAPAPPTPAPAPPVAAPRADPFAAAPPRAIQDEDPFASPLPGGPAADPFGATASAPPEPSPADAAPAPAFGGADDHSPFPPEGTAPAEAPEGAGAPPPVASGDPGGFGSLSLEEATTPPARRISRAAATAPAPAPMPMMAASEDPFGGDASFGAGLSVLDEGVLATAVPQAGGEVRDAAVGRRDAESEPPLQLDPFGAAAVAADPLAVGEPPRAVEPPPPAETTAERRGAGRAFRIRDVLVSAMALAALLLLSLTILVVWRGGLASGDALRPAAIVRALAPRPPSGVLSAGDVTSGLYERAHGAPLLFVRGTVTSSAPATLEEVRVIVEVVRDGAVLLRGEAPVGAVPGPEALHGAADAAGLARALAEAATPGGARLAPGGSAPFLVAFADYPANLGGASLRIHTAVGPGR